MIVPKEKSAELLTNWVALKHKGQKKKYTGEPYLTHLIAVAEMAKPVTMLGYEIGLCHDLFEDTKTTESELFEALLSFKYDELAANYITSRVAELTDVFTSTAYPGLSREARKEREALRLLTISAGAQTVKYCDLIYNMELVLLYDRENAEQYLKKKKLLLFGMVVGDKDMHQKALETINEGLKILRQ